MFRKKYTTKIINGSLASIPWAEANKIYTTAAIKGLSDYTASMHAQYHEAFEREKSRRELIAGSVNPEAGSFEGDVNLEYSPPALSEAESRVVKQKAGEKALQEHFIENYQLKSFGLRVMEEILVIYKNHKLNKAGTPRVLADGSELATI